MNPPTAAPVVDQATPMFFPDGNLAYDEELGRLQEARRKASENSEMMREMEGEHFLLLSCLTDKRVRASPPWMLDGTLSTATGGNLKLGLVASFPTLMARCLSLPKCLRFIRIFRGGGLIRARLNIAHDLRV